MISNIGWEISFVKILNRPKGDMQANDSDRLKKLYQVEEKRFMERAEKYEETSHAMDIHQYYLESAILRKEVTFYRYLPSHNNLEHSEDSIGFDYEFIHKSVGKVGWKGNESLSEVSSKASEVVKFPVMDVRNEDKKTVPEPEPQAKEPRARGVRLYVCEIEGCDKKYTSSFGLKYHMKEGHSQEKMNIFKPFSCPFEDCGKKYKNSNGLKYHMKHYHEDQPAP